MIEAVWLPDRQAQTATGEITTIVIVTWDDEADKGTAWVPDGESVAVALVGRNLTIQDTLDLTPIEDEIIANMRACIEAMDTDQSHVRDKYDAAHHLFGSHLTAWSEEFGSLYNSMLEIYRAKTPKATGHYRTRHVGIGYSSFETRHWIQDKVQPPIPSAEELLERFDARIRVYRKVEVGQ